MSTRVLILGATGMAGHKLLERLSEHDDLDVTATARDPSRLPAEYPEELRARVIGGVDAWNPDSIMGALAATRPDVVVNCIGLIKQLPIAREPLPAITVNAQLPHRLAVACRAARARLVQIGTDCVFDGRKGGYTEDDPSDAADLYGRTKYLGEVSAPGTLTLRTSIIGHELAGRLSLVEWFLAQRGRVKGFQKAIYTGLPTTELARVLAEVIFPRPELEGLYHLSVEPISKYDLLGLIAARYEKPIEIEPEDQTSIDRSLDSTRLRQATGYAPPSWEELIEAMHEDYRACPWYPAYPDATGR